MEGIDCLHGYGTSHCSVLAQVFPTNLCHCATLNLALQPSCRNRTIKPADPGLLNTHLACDQRRRPSKKKNELLGCRTIVHHIRTPSLGDDPEADRLSCEIPSTTWPLEHWQKAKKGRKRKKTNDSAPKVDSSSSLCSQISWIR